MLAGVVPGMIGFALDDDIADIEMADLSRVEDTFHFSCRDDAVIDAHGAVHDSCFLGIGGETADSQDRAAFVDQSRLFTSQESLVFGNVIVIFELGREGGGGVLQIEIDIASNRLALALAGDARIEDRLSTGIMRRDVSMWDG